MAVTTQSATGIAGGDDLLHRKHVLRPEEPTKGWDICSSWPSSKQRVTKQALWKDSRDNALNDKVNSLENVSTADPLLLSLIWGCSKNKDLRRGSALHDELLSTGLDERSYSDALITMYANCGELEKAQGLLDLYNSGSLMLWTALIGGYARKGQGHSALECFEKLQHEGIRPNAVTYICILKACAKIRAIEKGKQIHEEIMRQGLLKHSVELGNALVDMYSSKCGDLSKAHRALENLPSRNVITWSALIAGYAQKGQGEQALECYHKMLSEGIHPDAVTYVCVLKACAIIKAIDKGKQIHEEISRKGLLEHNILVGSALVDMYAKCGAFLQAQHILEQLPCRDAVSWSALIAGYAQHGQGQQALDCYKQMQHDGIKPDVVTYVCVLNSCSIVGAIDMGNQMYEEVSKQGLLKNNLVLGNALVDMYAKCGALDQARRILENLPSRNVVSWNALITGYIKKGQCQQALDGFEQMQQQGIRPNAVTYLCILKACAITGAIDLGKKIHDEISKKKLLNQNIMLGNALVDMYAKCNDLPQAHIVLEDLPSRNVVSWSALIAGYIEKEQGQRAWECFERMQQEGISPDAVTYLSILKACAISREIDHGKQIHDEISKQGLLENNIILGNALVDMYVKCGALLQAHNILEKLSARDVVTWNTVISGYAQEGQVEQALKSFKQMQDEGILPDTVTYLCLLNLCSRLGLVEKGQELFDDMGAKHGLEPDLECFSCMVDLLGRAGHLPKAVKIIQEMPCSANIAIWLCLLGACQKWIDVDVGTWAFERAVHLDKCNWTAYFSMMNIFTEAGMPEKARDIENLRIKNKFARK